MEHFGKASGAVKEGKLKKALCYFFAALLASFICLAVAGVSPQTQPIPYRPSVLSSARPAGLDADFGKIPLQFIPNQGQTDGRVDFYVQGRNKTVYFTDQGLTFALNGGSLERWIVKLDFVDLHKNVKPVGLEKSGTVVSYFKGKPDEWKAGLPAYSKIIYWELWPGIDLVYSGTVNRMKYQFVVRPGADPAWIKLAYRGAQSVRLTEEGQLAVETPAGGFQDEIPIAYQEIGGHRVDIPVAYVLDKNAENRSIRFLSEGKSAEDVPEAGSDRPGLAYGFDVGTYDRSRTLVLDPAVFVYCGFIGGSGADAAYDIAVDSSGNAYIAGETSSTELTFPATVGPDLGYNGGTSDAFVAKVDATGTALIYCGYIGGAGVDCAKGVGVDSTGNCYLTGFTDSTETTFPVTVGPDLMYNGGDSDAFVAKVDATGTRLVYCGYIGGTGMDRAEGLALHPEGVSYIVGSTDSLETTFPVTGGPDPTYNGGASDAFVAVLYDSGDELFYCSYIGGAGKDEGLGIALYNLTPYGGYPFVDIVGTTSSTESTFPVAWGPDLTYNGGDSDGFIARIDPWGDEFWLCGYIGGSGTDVASGIAGFNQYISEVEGKLLTFVTGTTSSTESTFPVVGGPDLTYNGGDSDVFVARLNDSQTGWHSCGYIGGSGTDVATDIACDGYGYYGEPQGWTRYTGALITGYTSSTESTFPVRIGPDLTYNGGASDAFVAKIAPWGGGDLLYCGYIGGPGRDESWEVATIFDDPALFLPVPGDQHFYIAGNTSSTESAFPVAVGPDLTYNGGASDAFAVRGKVLRPTMNALSPSTANPGDPELTLVVTGSDFLDGAAVVFGGNWYQSWGWGPPPAPATFVSSTELHKVIPANALKQPGSIDVGVINPDGGVASGLRFDVLYPVPSLSALIPEKATGGGSGFYLSLRGSQFLPGAVVLWNGSSRPATYMSGTELQTAISAQDIAVGGEYQITVSNSAPTSGVSNAMVFTVSGFTMASSPASATVTAGQSATYSIQLTPQFGAFDSPISFVCEALPNKCGASFSPATVTPGTGMATTTLTLTTQASAGSALGAISGRPGSAPLASGLLPFILLGLISYAILTPTLADRRRRWLTAAALVCLMFLISSCSVGEGPNPPPYTGTPKGNHYITVKGTSGGMSVSTVINLTVM